MKKNKVLILILATTFSPFLIAAILTTDFFSQQLEKKQYGKFLTSELYLLPNSKPTSQWQLVISATHKNHDEIFKKLSNIKTALGKRSDLVNVLSTHTIDAQSLANNESIYIATPNKGQLLLAYTHEQVGKPLFKDLSHLLRSNN